MYYVLELNKDNTLNIYRYSLPRGSYTFEKEQLQSTAPNAGSIVFLHPL